MLIQLLKSFCFQSRTLIVLNQKIQKVLLLDCFLCWQLFFFWRYEAVFMCDLRIICWLDIPTRREDMFLFQKKSHKRKNYWLNKVCFFVIAQLPKYSFSLFPFSLSPFPLSPFPLSLLSFKGKSLCFLFFIFLNKKVYLEKQLLNKVSNYVHEQKKNLKR